MANLHLTCFNTFQVTRNGEPVTRWHSVKTRALLVYLVVEQTSPHQRDLLAGLLWPDLSEQRARRNLSQNLMELRRTIGDTEATATGETGRDSAFFKSDTHTIAFNPASDHWVDALAFAAQLAILDGHRAQTHGDADASTCPACAAALQQAVALYTGPFLDGFSVNDSDLFEKWLLTQREYYHRRAVEVFGRLATYYEQQGDLPQAQRVVHQLLDLAPWQEEAHRQLMRLLALQGRRTDALAQYDACCQALEDELGVPPSAETNALYDQILAGEIAAITELAVELTPVAPTPRQPNAPAFPPPPEPAQPPHMDEFIGRQAELTFFADQLSRTHRAIISGMAGIGKSALAIALAQQWQSTAQGNAFTAPQLFWHTFHDAEGIMSFVWKLAGFLAWHGQPGPWEMLQTAQLTGAQPPPPEALFDYLLQGLRGQAYLLCLDDIHLIDGDPFLRHFMGRMAGLLANGDVALILTSRQTPDYFDGAATQPIGGLTTADVARLSEARGLLLDGGQLDALYTHTEGNAQLVNLAISVLKQAHLPEQAMAQLAAADNIERYLIREIDERLNAEEREILVAVAVILGYPGNRHLLEAVVDRTRLKGALRTLTDHHLLVRYQGNRGDSTREDDNREDAYSAHAIVRAFYYDLPSRRELRAMHQRAARYYEVDEPDQLKAVVHYQRAGEMAKAANLATQHIWLMVNQGEAWLLHNLLTGFAEADLAPTLWARVNIALGDLQTYLGSSADARKQYASALSLLEGASPATEIQELYARACLGMGDSFRYESTQSAVNWLQRGLAVVDMVDDGLEDLAAALQISLGVSQMLLGNFGPSENALAAAMAHLPATPSRLRTSALLNLGNLHYYQGDLARAQHFTQQALHMSQALQDDFQTVAILNNMGIDQLLAGDWPTAAVTLEEALALARRLGDVARQSELELSLGHLRIKQGLDEAAYTQLTHCLELTHQHGLEVNRFTTQLELANLYLCQGEPAAAHPLLMACQQLAATVAVGHKATELYRLLALMHLQSGALEQAFTYAQQAVAFSHTLTMPLEEGMSLRVLGQVLVAQNEGIAASAAFQQSLLLLAEHDFYEAARTHLAWGAALFQQGDVGQGQPLLEAAHATFVRLSAQRELAKIAALYQAMQLPARQETRLMMG